MTLDASNTIAQAVAVKGGRIVEVGDHADVLATRGPASRPVDLAGGTAMPGLNDSHLHLQWFGLQRPPFSLDLSVVTSIDEVRRMVAEKAATSDAGTWIRGRGWTEHSLSG
ncbi:MAG: amidohydrolase family protein, partial [Mycobacterium sp.]